MHPRRYVGISFWIKGSSVLVLNVLGRLESVVDELQRLSAFVRGFCRPGQKNVGVASAESGIPLH